jgi:hypothetical protein
MIEEAEVEVEEVDTLTNALADAWDASENDDGTEQQGDTVLESAGEPTVSESGEPAEGDGETLHKDWVRRSEEDPNAVGEQSEGSEKPPVGLSLEAREAWKDVPDSVKADIVKRENDYANGIAKHRQATQRVQGMDRALQPYQQYLQMNGGAGKTIQTLLQTGSSLQMGSPQQKAQVVANLIQQFGVDIKSLDSMLVGEAPAPAQQQHNQVEQMLNQRLKPMQQQLQGYQQREQHQRQQVQGKVAQEVNQFGTSNEFYNDVRGDMADLLDMAANRGREMSMSEAYNLACNNHPQISKIMSGRVSQKSVDTKRQAASSIQGSPGGGMSKGAPNSTMAALNDAWDGAGRM